MSSIKAYAQEVFSEVNKRNTKNKFEVFIKEFTKLVKESERESKDVKCVVSNDCSREGCYRYSVCTFKDELK